MTADHPTTEPTTGSVALAEVLADMTEADPPADPDATTSDDLLDGIAGIERTLAALLPPGKWRAVTKFDRRHLQELDLTDLQFDCWDVDSAREVVKAMPWGDVHEYVQPGLHYDFFTWDGTWMGLRIRVIGPEQLPTAAPRWWSKPKANEAPEGGASDE